MPKIRAIQNVTTSAILDATGTWTLAGGLPQQVDEVVIRQITYSGMTAAPFDVYLIGSSLTGGIIGTVCAAQPFVSTPGTTIRLSTVQTHVRFQLLDPVTMAPTNQAVGDFISINFDFIRTILMDGNI